MRKCLLYGTGEDVVAGQSSGALYKSGDIQNGWSRCTGCPYHTLLLLLASPRRCFLCTPV